MQLFTICIFTFALAICYVKANDHHTSHSTTLAPEVEDRKKREEGPPHPTPRERKSLRERRQLPLHEPITPHTPSPSRRKRHSLAATTTAQVNPIMEQADEMADAIDESESAGVKKRETEESVNSSNDEVEEEEDTTATTEITIEKKEGEEEETVSEDNEKAQIPRAKRVSHAGSSHKNRPSAVNRLQSNSNVGENNEEEEQQKEPEHEHEDVHHHDYELDHIHTY
uniref:Uncharacterized protein n=1 Tax=Panagrolaimus sp. PS1159 TaxID=55785 RepID=A0AC35FT18_9BILA